VWLICGGCGFQQDDLVSVDKSFVKWSPLRAWEEEKVVGSLPASTASSLVDITLPGIQRHPSVGGHAHSGPIIGTLALPSINFTSSRKVVDRSAMEVLGPVEHVPGQPIAVNLEMGGASSGKATPTKSRVLTMLYRRYGVNRECCRIGFNLIDVWCRENL